MPLLEFICLLLLAVYTVAPAFANALTVGAPGNPFDGDCAPFGCALEYQQAYGAGLSFADETDDHRPGLARPEPNKVVRFGLTVTTLLADAIRIPCTLRLVVDPDMFGGCSLLGAFILFEEAVYIRN